MIQTYTYDKETWTDINQGTKEDIVSIMGRYSIDPFIGKELTSLTRRSRLEVRKHYLYCILHFPVWKHSHKGDGNQEIDFVLGPNFLVTARYDTIDTLEKYAKTLQMKEVIEEDTDTGTHVIFTEMLYELYGSLSNELAFIEDRIEEITGHIFQGKERKMVVAISEMMRTLLEFRKSTDTHRDILDKLHKHGGDMFGEAFAKNIEGVQNEYSKIQANIRANIDMLRELRDTNNSLLTTSQNEIIKQLTVMGFILLPLNLVTWIFAMRVEGGMPLIDHPNGFFIVIGLMILYAVIALSIAKIKKWL